MKKIQPAISVLLMFSILLFVFTACSLKVNTNYNIGDIVYIKPDTIQAVVTNNKSCSGVTVSVSYRNTNGDNHEVYVREEEIFKEWTNRPKPTNY
jgi:hypothetical protein